MRRLSALTATCLLLVGCQSGQDAPEDQAADEVASPGEESGAGEQAEAPAAAPVAFPIPEDAAPSGYLSAELGAENGISVWRATMVTVTWSESSVVVEATGRTQWEVTLTPSIEDAEIVNVRLCTVEPSDVVGVAIDLEGETDGFTSGDVIGEAVEVVGLSWDHGETAWSRVHDVGDAGPTSSESCGLAPDTSWNLVFSPFEEHGVGRDGELVDLAEGDWVPVPTEDGALGGWLDRSADQFAAPDGQVTSDVRSGRPGASDPLVVDGVFIPASSFLSAAFPVGDADDWISDGGVQTLMANGVGVPALGGPRASADVVERARAGMEQAGKASEDWTWGVSAWDPGSDVLVVDADDEEAILGFGPDGEQLFRYGDERLDVAMPRFAPNGWLVAIGMASGYFVLLDIADESVIREGDACRAQVSTVAPPDGALLITACRDVDGVTAEWIPTASA